MLPLYLMGKNHQNPGTYSVSFGYSNEKMVFSLKRVLRFWFRILALKE